MIPKTTKYIIFDYDGVLGNSDAFNTYACKESAKMCGIDLSEEIYRKYAYLGATIKDIALGIVNHYGKPEMVEQYIEYKKTFDSKYHDEVKIYEGVVEVISNLSKEYKLGIATGSRRVLIDMFLDRYDLAQYIDTVVTGDDVKHGKPDPEIYLKAFSNLGANASDCLIIEDGESGIIAGKSAGAYAIGITNSTSQKNLFDAGADMVINTLSELMVPISD